MCDIARLFPFGQNGHQLEILHVQHTQWERNALRSGGHRVQRPREHGPSVKVEAPSQSEHIAEEDAGVIRLDDASDVSNRWSKRRHAFVASLAVLALLLVLPVLALGTPPGQRLVERAIAAPLLARLEASAPAPFTLKVDELSTRVGGTTIRVDLVGAVLAAPGLSLTLDEMSVRVRYMDVLRRNLVPDRITVETARLEVNDLQPMRELSRRVQAPSASAFDSPDVASIDNFEALAPTALEQTEDVSTADLLASLRLDGLVNAFDALDRALTEITVGDTWQSLESITVDQLVIAPRPDAGVPFLRDPDDFQVTIDRENAREMIARVTTVDRARPLSLIVRHAESGAPEGPSVLARVAGAEIDEDQAFSHLLLRGLATSDFTDALTSDGPVTFESNLAAEIVVTRDDGDGAVNQIAALFESDAGYLVASQRAATILEFASVPMIYTRESGRFDIVSAQVQFQETGGVFNGTLAPAVRNDRRGLTLKLQAPNYRLAIPPEPELGRSLQRALGSVSIELFVDDNGRLIELPLMQVAMGDVRIAYAGLMELNERGTFVSLVGQSTPMRVPHLAALWPLPISPQARGWFLENVAEGRLGESTFSFAARLEDIEVEDGRTYLIDDMLHLSAPYQNLVMRTAGDLPPVFGLDGTIEVTGRTVHMLGTGGVGRLETGETIAVPRAEFFIADHADPDPLAWLELDLDGPASGFAQMALMDPLELDDAIPFDPETVTGRVELSSRIEAVLADEIDRDTVRATTQALVTDFASSEPVEGRELSDGNFRIVADELGTSLIGQARLDGVLTDLNLSPENADGLQLAMTLDADDRRQMGLDFGEYLTGTIGVDVGQENADGERRMVIDLTDATITIAELGYRKPAGVSSRASFTVSERENQRQIRDLVVAADGLAVRGSLDFLDGDLRVAEFESVAIDGIGRFALDLTRNSQNTSARLTGDRFVLTPDLLRGDREAAGALSLDVEVGELVTQKGARLADVRLTYTQTGERITAFDLRARHTDGTDLVGTLAPAGAGNNLVISSGNAGTFLRFLGLYERAQGGRATLVLDPQSVGGRVAGQLLLSDFEIVDEPAMERIFTSGRDQAGNASDVVLPGEFETADRIEIEVTNITFDRTPERLIIHSAEGWGPSLGGNIDGVIDYQADRVQLAGTYVPFFTINNIFSRIPILGQALGGRDSEGLLAVTFALTGSVDSPQLQVNPMSILAPGVFRNIFEYQQGG